MKKVNGSRFANLKIENSYNVLQNGNWHGMLLTNTSEQNNIENLFQKIALKMLKNLCFKMACTRKHILAFKIQR